MKFPFCLVEVWISHNLAICCHYYVLSTCVLELRSLDTKCVRIFVMTSWINVIPFTAVTWCQRVLGWSKCDFTEKQCNQRSQHQILLGNHPSAGYRQSTLTITIRYRNTQTFCVPFFFRVCVREYVSSCFVGHSVCFIFIFVRKKVLFICNSYAFTRSIPLNTFSICHQ